MQGATPVLNERVRVFRTLLSPFRKVAKDTSRFFGLRKEIRQLGHDTAMAKSMKRYAKGIRNPSATTANAHYLERLAAKSKAAGDEYAGVVGRQVVRGGLAAVGISGAGYGARAYRARRDQVRQKARYRKFDVYGRHGYAASGATKHRRPYYDTPQGGREMPRRSGSPAVREETEVTLLEAVKGKRPGAVNTPVERLFRMNPNAFTPEQVARMERSIKADPKALKHYRALRRIYGLQTGVASAIISVFLMQMLGFKALSSMAMGTVSGVSGSASAKFGARAPRTHRKALRGSFAIQQTRKKYNRLMPESVQLSDAERQKIIERIVNTQEG